MKNKKKVIMLAIGVILLLTLVIGASYAYFSATVSGNGNDNGTSSITTAELPSLIYINGENFNGENVYPGYKNIHVFTVIPQPNSKGTAIYVLHLNANVPNEFGSDIKVTVYKTTDKVNNNLSRTEGELISVLGSDGKYQYSKSDTITLNGTPEKVYESILETNNDIILEEKQFDGSLQETTYFLVYEYVENNSNQDNTQGKSFTGKVTVSLQRELSPIKPLSQFGIQDTLASEGNGLYEVKHDDEVIGTHMNSEQTNNLKQTEYRYAGKNPNNYILFNNELWRVIGLVNTPEGSRIKLIRNESIGSYSWDSSDISINGGWGVNEWSESDIMKLLNPDFNGTGGSLYWNSQSGNCYNASKNGTIPCDFTSIGLKESTKEKIDRITWNTGTNGGSGYKNEDNGLTTHFYNHEHSNHHGNICTNSDCDTLSRTTIWNGIVGLMSPSDYGYATSANIVGNREMCLKKILYYWDTEETCYTNNYLFNKANQWTINPFADSMSNIIIFKISSTGLVGTNGTIDKRDIRPSVYLKLNQKIVNGDGSQSNPYLLK